MISTGTSCVSLTVPGEQLPEVDGEIDPVLADDRVPVAPDADVHGACARLRGQACEVDGLLGEVVHTPALALVRGKSTQKQDVEKIQKTKGCCMFF